MAETGKRRSPEAMLYLAKATDRLGKVADGNTVCDFDPEEIKRGFSLSTSLANFEWKGKKINLLDTPGYFDFVGEVQQAVAVAGSAIIVLEAKGGVKVGAELAWDAAAAIPKAFFVNKMDDENADFDAVFQSLRDKFGKSVCPVIVPYGEGAEMGYYNLLQEEAYTFDKTGARTAVPLPDAYKEKMAGYQSIIFESLAETSEELMEKFFAEEPFTHEELETALNRGLCSGDIAPVFCGSALNFAGLRTLLNYIASSFASPLDRCEKTVIGPDGEPTTIKASPEGAPSLFVFKTVADAFGKKTYFKVMNGTLKKDAQLVNLTTGRPRRSAASSRRWARPTSRPTSWLTAISAIRSSWSIPIPTTPSLRRAGRIHIRRSSSRSRISVWPFRPNRRATRTRSPPALPSCWRRT